MASKAESMKVVLDCGIIPVVRAESAEQAMEIAEALKAGGLPVIEITMTVPGAFEVMREVSRRFGKEVVLGAGTVLDGETARMAILAGAEFIVAPNLDRGTIEVCSRYSKISVPGALTPTEAVTAWQWGADLVKIFPVDTVGGPKYISALRAPLPHILYVPTGGVDLANTAAFIKAGAAALGVGASLVDKKAVAEKKYEVITDLAKRFIEEIKKARSS
jgi:2-dehydro-3-deoxyphosphogluconate aldolase/(4S)-4-hydroxy-2-oxoglutarate aldolase